VPELSERRIRAACLFLVEQHADQRGDCFVYRTDLINETVEFLENPSIGPQEVDMIITRAAEADILVDDNGRIYQKRLYQQETELARMLSTMLSQPLPNELAGPAVDKAIMSALGSVGMELHATQVEAIDRTLRSKISIITGGPGTGKTTITKAVVAGYQSAGVPITLLAPTGSASRRMTKVIGVPASTVHRKLFALDKLRKKNNLTLEEVQIHGVVIVDEGSMADLFIAHWIATYLAPDAVLVIVGDEDQLPSVGPGSILRDLIACGRVAVTKLTHIFRQAAGSDIIRHAHAINKGIVPPIARINREHVLARGWPQSDFVMMEVVDQDKQAKAAVWAATTLARSMGFDPKTDVQVLTPMRKGDAGVANLNKVLQEAINPNPPESIDRPDGTHWGTGDRLMQLCNHYPGKDDSNPYYLFNGEQGLLTSFVREEDAKRSVEGINTNFDDDEILIERADFNELTLANAMTVHKSQGSEYAMVIIVLHTAHYVLLQRNLFYTGVTRGRKFVVLITHPDALSMAVHNNRISKRNTYLQERLNEEEAPGGTEQIHLAA
jgi:exodeoxyribonuclease V alpha subunit